MVSVWFMNHKPFSGDIGCRLLTYSTDSIVVLGGDQQILTSAESLSGLASNDLAIDLRSGWI